MEQNLYDYDFIFADMYGVEYEEIHWRQITPKDFNFGLYCLQRKYRVYEHKMLLKWIKNKTTNNMKKELLTVEFRYCDAPQDAHDCEHKYKTITIGVYDSLEEAIKKGNEVVQELSQYFEVRHDDKFSLNGGIIGSPERLVTNYCHQTNGVAYFAKITQLNFTDMPAVIQEAFKAAARYNEYLKEQEAEI